LADGANADAAPAVAQPTWAARIGATTANEAIITAETFIRRRSSASAPVDVGCSDGKTYVVKGLRNDSAQGRMIFNDQVIARFGQLLSAPVAEVALIEISQALIDLNPHPASQMGNMIPCTAHGSCLLPNVTDRVDAISHTTEGTNKERFARIGILHAWMGSSDRQFIYETNAPFRVFSVDHGHFSQAAQTGESPVFLLPRQQWLPAILYQGAV
jgi:hypothetical protein